MQLLQLHSQHLIEQSLHIICLNQQIIGPLPQKGRKLTAAITLASELKSLLPNHIFSSTQSELQVLLITQEVDTFEEKPICFTMLEGLLVRLLFLPAAQIKPQHHSALWKYFLI